MSTQVMNCEMDESELLEIEVDGRALKVHQGETVAAALLRNGLHTFRHTSKKNEPRSYFCGIGICQECLVTIDGIPNIQACRTKVRADMKIKTQSGLPLPVKES